MLHSIWHKYLMCIINFNINLLFIKLFDIIFPSFNLYITYICLHDELHIQMEKLVRFVWPWKLSNIIQSMKLSNCYSTRNDHRKRYLRCVFVLKDCTVVLLVYITRTQSTRGRRGWKNADGFMNIYVVIDITWVAGNRIT